MRRIRIDLNEATDQEFLNKVKKIPKYAGDNRLTLKLVSTLAQLDPDTTVKPDGRITRVGGSTEKLLDLFFSGDATLLKKIKTPTGREFLKQLLQQYVRFKKQLKNFGYSGVLQDCSSIDEVQRQVQLVSATDQRKLVKTPEMTDSANKDIIIWAENDDWKVASPLNRAGAQYLGRNSSWCTARKNTAHYYNLYNGYGRLFVFINKKAGASYQYCNGDLSGSYVASFNNERNTSIGPLAEWAKENGVPEEWVLAVQSARFSAAGKDGEWYTRIQDQAALRREVHGTRSASSVDPALIAVRNAMKTIIDSDWRVLQKKLQSDFVFKDWATNHPITNFSVTPANSEEIPLITITVWDVLIEFPNSESWSRIPTGDWLNASAKSDLDDKFRRIPEASSNWYVIYSNLGNADVSKLPESVVSEESTHRAVLSYKRDLEKAAESMVIHRDQWVCIKDVQPPELWMSIDESMEMFDKLATKELGGNWAIPVDPNDPESARERLKQIIDLMQETYGLYNSSFDELHEAYDSIDDENYTAGFWETKVRPAVLSVIQASVQNRTESLQLRFLRSMPQSLVRLGILPEITSLDQILQLPVLVIWIGNELDYLDRQMQNQDGALVNTQKWSRRHSVRYATEGYGRAPMVSDDYVPEESRIPSTQADIRWETLTWDLYPNGEIFYDLDYMLSFSEGFSDTAKKLQAAANRAVKAGGLNIEEVNRKLRQLSFERYGVTAQDNFINFNSKELFDPMLDFITKVLYLTWYVSGVRDFFIQWKGLKENPPPRPENDDEDNTEYERAQQEWEDNMHRIRGLSVNIMNQVSRSLFPSRDWEPSVYHAKDREYPTYLSELYKDTESKTDLIAHQIVNSQLTPAEYNRVRMYRYWGEMKSVKRNAFSTDILPYTTTMITYFKGLAMRAQRKINRGMIDFEDTNIREYLGELAPFGEDFLNTLRQVTDGLYDSIGHVKLQETIQLLNTWLVQAVNQSKENE